MSSFYISLSKRNCDFHFSLEKYFNKVKLTSKINRNDQIQRKEEEKEKPSNCAVKFDNNQCSASIHTGLCYGNAFWLIHNANKNKIPVNPKWRANSAQTTKKEVKAIAQLKHTHARTGSQKLFSWIKSTLRWILLFCFFVLLCLIHFPQCRRTQFDRNSTKLLT